VERGRIRVEMIRQVEDFRPEFEESSLASRNVLFTEKSALAIPGRRIASVRGDVPKRPKGASTKAAVLNHRCHVRWPRGRLPFCPETTSGRELIPVPVVSTLLVTGEGKPL